MQVGHVDAGNEQYESHRAQQDPKGLPHAADQIFLQWHHRCRRRGELLRMVLLDVGRNGRHLIARPIHSDTGLEAAKYPEIVRSTPVHGFVENLAFERHPEVHVLVRELEARRHNAGDRIFFAIERKRAAENSRVRAHAALPQGITQNHGARGFGPVVLREKIPPADGTHAQHGEQAGGDGRPLQPFGIRAAPFD